MSAERNDDVHAPASMSARLPSSSASAPRTADHHALLPDLLARALPGAAPESVNRLTAVARLKTLGSGELIFRQGEPIPLTLVLHGYGAFRRTTAHGRQLVFGVAKPGWLFGYSGIGGQLASVDLVSVTPTMVGLWFGADLRDLLVADPGLALSVIDGMGRYVVSISDRLEGFIHQEARGRVLRVLAEYADLFFSEPPVLPRTLVSGLVGTSREMTGRVLRALESEGVLARVGRTGLRLLDPAALEDGRPSRADD